MSPELALARARQAVYEATTAAGRFGAAMQHVDGELDEEAMGQLAHAYVQVSTALASIWFWLGCDTPGTAQVMKDLEP